MSFWHRKKEEFVEMVEILEQQPGLNANQLAERLGVSPSTVTRRLPSMNDAGIYLSEDKSGGLHLFGTGYDE